MAQKLEKYKKDLEFNTEATVLIHAILHETAASLLSVVQSYLHDWLYCIAVKWLNWK